MADDITLPGTGAVVNTRQQPDNSHNQVVEVDGELLTVLQSLTIALQQMVKTLGLSIPDIAGRLRVSLDATSGTLTITTVSSVTTVVTVNGVTNQGQMGGVAANDQIPALMAIAAKSLRNQIIVS